MKRITNDKLNEVYAREVLNVFTKNKGENAKIEKLKKDRHLLKYIVYVNIKFISTYEYIDDLKDEDLYMLLLGHMEYIDALINLMTPKELMNIFPIEKTYDGAKYEVKDYFSTMEAINTIGVDTPIKNYKDSAFGFLWDYSNLDICKYLVSKMIVMSRLNNIFANDITLAGGFAMQNNIPTYEERQMNGKKYLFDSQTGKYTRIQEKKKRPLYLRVVKKKSRRNKH